MNRAVAAAAEARRTFVLAVDDPASASAYGAGVVRRGGVTVAVSTDGRAPALAGLLREALEAVLPDELASWTAEAERMRRLWKAQAACPWPSGGRCCSTRSTGSTPSAKRRARRRRPRTTRSPRRRASPTRRRARVSLVGAGPGDPELITVRGARRLAEADLVLYDALGSERLRDLAPQARWFYVGKRACRQSIGQDVLNRLLVKNARRGLKVVRLKCGDPFVFGRGGEEALALAEAGFACEIVPGVSSAVAAPALAGIPVTHRGMASSFAVVTGHHEETYGPLLASFAPGSLTLVVMMGLRQRARVAELLVARGWDRATPAAIVVGAATPESWRWTGTLEGLGAAEIPPDVARGAGPARHRRGREPRGRAAPRGRRVGAGHALARLGHPHEPHRRDPHEALHGGRHAGRRRRLVHGALGRHHGAARPLGLGQVHRAAHDRGPRAARRRAACSSTTATARRRPRRTAASASCSRATRSSST